MIKDLIFQLTEGNRGKIAFGLFLVLSVSYLLFSEPEKIILTPEEPALISEANLPYTKSDEDEEIVSLQNSFIKIAKMIKPAVVHISSLQETLKSHEHGRVFKNKFSLERFNNFFEELFTPKKYSTKSLGSGVIFSSQGYILTNHHVVEGAEHIFVQLSDNRRFEGTLIGSDKKTDLAVIKINSFKSLPQALLGNSENIRVGEWVVAIGNPYGLDGTVTVGVISATGRSDIGIADYENFIQTDASINPGNSGGPLLDLEGNVIGINTAIIGQGTGIGFAIPIDMAKLISDQLIKNGEVERGWLGAGIQTLTPELAETFNTGFQKGVLVNNIIPDAPADKGGLRQGDIIVRFEGNPVVSSKELQQMVAFSKIGGTVKIKVFRNGEMKTIKIKVEKIKS